MKVVSVYIPESYITRMEFIIKRTGLYPSRSELVRVAVREFIIRELKKLKDGNNPNTEKELSKERTMINRIQNKKCPICKSNRPLKSEFSFINVSTNSKLYFCSRTCKLMYVKQLRDNKCISKRIFEKFKRR